jgi:mycothiol synthase
MTFPFLPPGFAIRHPSMDDLQAVVALVNAYELFTEGEISLTGDQMLSEWRKPDFELDRDAWLVIAPERRPSEGGVVVGYQELWNRSEHASLSGDGYVHPRYTGLGIGTTMLRMIEARAQEHIPLASPGRQVVLRNGVSGEDKAACELHEHEGYHPRRYFWEMGVQMRDAPPQPDWPPGIELGRFVPGRDERAVFEAFNEAFQDHWGYTPWDYDWWLQRMMEKEGFDPSLWFLAMDGKQIAGGSLCHYRLDYGWVKQVAVRRPWRRRGLGLALLRHSLGEFYRRDILEVRLKVDAQNPTGATRLYEQAGMRVLHEYILYEKILRVGLAV